MNLRVASVMPISTFASFRESRSRRTDACKESPLILLIVCEGYKIPKHNASQVGVTLMGVAPYQPVATMPESMPAA